MLDFTLQKISKPNYKTIRTTLKSYSSRFNHLHDDADLKKMSPVQAVELILWFLQEAFGVERSHLLDNFSPDFYAAEGLPLAEKVDSCVALANANMLFYKGIAKINQHLPFHFNMILTPEQY